MRNWIVVSALVALLAAAPGTAHAYDEMVDGELSANAAAPTPVAFGLGTSVVIGTVNSTSDLRDYLTFTIPAGRQLSALRLVTWTPSNTGFHAINAGTTSFVPSAATADSFLGGDHVTVAIVGTDTLPDLAEGDVAGVGFTPPLGPGTYSYLIQQTSSTSTHSYNLEFVVSAPPAVPGLSTMWVAALVVALLAIGLLVARNKVRDLAW